MLSVVMQHAQSTDFVVACMQHLTYAASTSPSCLAGNGQVLDAVLQTCLGIAHHASVQVDAKLAGFQVLASLLSVSNSKQTVLSGIVADVIGPNGVFPVCLGLCVNGIDDDVQSWAEEPASLVVSVP